MKDILLLHGAIGCKTQLEPLAQHLEKNYRVHLFNLPGHGGEAFPAGGFSIEGFAATVLQYLDEHAIPAISIFGYSMGGYVALYFAGKYPHRVEKVITLATKFNWDENIAAAEMKMLQPQTIEEKLPAFAQELARRHAPLDWKEQLMHTAKLLESLGRKNVLTADSYKAIAVPCMVMLGDRDKMVTLAETVEVYRQLPHASLAVLPQTGHPIEKAEATVLAFYIGHFLQKAWGS